MRQVYGIKSIVMIGLISIAIVCFGYFIIRQWYVWGGFVLIVVVDNIRTMVSRYQIAIVDKEKITLRSLFRPGSKAVVVLPSDTREIVIKDANAFSSLWKAGENRQPMRIQMHTSERKKLEDLVRSMGIHVRHSTGA
ncbi:MAG: hypothetical protein KF744_05125 [Taibaiella sp.]|nr:hypothetical protein [Taibaiella sp.]